MPINITMPALSPTMEEGTLSKWLVVPGDTVEAGDVIAEIETDKATMEVEAVDEGTVAQILIEAGSEGVKVNEVIAVLAEEGESVDDVKAPADSLSSPAHPRESGDLPKESAQPAEPDSRVRVNEVGNEKETPTKLASTEVDGDRIKASPLARRIAAIKGIDLASLKGKGSGPHGRIVKKDVEAAEPGQAAPPSERSAPTSPASGGGESLARWLDPAANSRRPCVCARQL
ncbi:MAG: biotin/lipoyl-containing protein [Pseudomonadota bacterium]